MNWLNYLPPGEAQSNGREDTEGCVSFSAVHCIESQELQRYGRTNEYSERALAKLSGTSIETGNSIFNVVNAINKYGLILEKDWPSDVISLEDFYREIPDEILKKAIPVKVTLTSNLDWNKAPVWTQLKISPTMNHFVEQVSDTQYFDSYKQYLKNIDHPVTGQWQLILNSNTMNNLQLINDKGTVYLVAGKTKKVKTGISDPDVLTALFGDEIAEPGDTSAIPETQTLAKGFVIHPK